MPRAVQAPGVVPVAAVMVSLSHPPTPDDRIRAALWFAERGFGVFSVWSPDQKGVCHCSKKAACESPGKHPIGSQGFKENTRDPARIRTLLSAGSHPNYGLVPPEGVFVLDVDGDGTARLVELEQKLGPLPVTYRTRTANGLHVYLRWPTDVPRPIGYLFGFVTRWGSGNNAGYVIGPRSVHPSGAVYEPIWDSKEIAELPEAWAHAVVDRESIEPFIEIDAGGYQLPDYGYTGSRYDAILRYTASRYMRGISQDEIFAGVVSVLAPRFESPLSEPELRSRFGRAWAKAPERLGRPIDFSAADVAAGSTIELLPNWPEPPDLAAYHGVVGELVHAVQERTEADPVGILGSLLATAGACMGFYRYIYQGSTQTANVFVVLVGETASGRKGTAGSIVREAMTAAYPTWEQLIVAGLGSGEGLITHLKKSEEDDEHRALVMESEFGRLLTVMNREGSTLSPVVRDAWDGVPMGRFLARSRQLVARHHVGILAHVTPVELRSKMTDVDAANGFGNRFLWLAVHRTRLVPFPESPRAALTPYLTPLHNAIAAAQEPAELHWTPEAAERWEWLYATLTTRPRHGIPGALAARAEAQIVRLALIYTLLDQASAIDLPHLEAAEALWNYVERSIGYVFGRTTGNRHADILRDLLADGPIEWESAKKALGLRTAADLRDAVETLVGLGVGEVVTIPRDSGGRPRRAIQLVQNPSEQTMQTMQTMQGTAHEKTVKSPKKERDLGGG